MRSRKVFLNTILGVVIAAGCAGEVTSPTLHSQADVASLSGLTLMNCNPLPVTTAQATIGKDGGTLTVGPHTFVVPEGALKKAVTITATTGGLAVNAVQFGPEGLQFARPALLTLSFANCGQWGQLKKAWLAYTDDLLNILESIEAEVNNSTKTVTGKVNHFSQYAVAY
jgi:hypothetical protein